jgi:hypothetical protein
MLTYDERIIVQSLVTHLDFMVTYAQQHESHRLAKLLEATVARGEKLLKETNT